MGTDPLITAVMSTFNGRDTAGLRLAGVEDDGTTATGLFKVAEEQSLDEEVGHVAEEVTGLAFAEEGWLHGTAYGEDIFEFV